MLAAARLQQGLVQRRLRRWCCSAVLGIETSCDDTAVAFVRRNGGRGKIVAESLSSQFEIHANYAGVVPAMAAREHALNMPAVLHEVLKETFVLDMLAPSCIVCKLPGVLRRAHLPKPDAIAVTAGPGLALCLRVGIVTAKALAAITGVPLMPTHHMKAHALMPLLHEPDIAFPYLCLLVSGGHTMLVLVKSPCTCAVVGTSMDDSLGEAFDKVARMVRVGRHTAAGTLPEPAPHPPAPHPEAVPPPWAGFSPTRSASLPQDPPVLGHLGAALEALAREGDPQSHRFTVPLSGNRGKTQAFHGRKRPAPHIAFSFSGLKTAVRRVADSQDMLQRQAAADVAASFQHVAGEHIARQVAAAAALPSAAGVRHLVVSGGAAANAALREKLEGVAHAAGLRFVAPPLRYCGDNAVMVAWAAALGGSAVASSESLDFAARWPIAESQPVVPPAAGRVWGDHRAEVQELLQDARYAFLHSHPWATEGTHHI